MYRDEERATRTEPGADGEEDEAAAPLRTMRAAMLVFDRMTGTSAVTVPPIELRERERDCAAPPPLR